MATTTCTGPTSSFSRSLNAAIVEIDADVQTAQARNVDETSWRVAGSRRWAWVAVTKRAVRFRITPTRSREALTLLVGETPPAITTSHRYGAYAAIADDQRQLCWAHLTRDHLDLYIHDMGFRRRSDVGSSSIEMLRPVKDDARDALFANWAWLDLGELTPIAFNPFGDTFFVGREGVFLLEIPEGRISLCFGDRDEMEERFADSTAIGDYVRGELLRDAFGKHALFGDDVFDFTIPLPLGGRYHVSNLKPVDYSVAVSVAGQIHQQTRTSG